jgi:FkbM family methyltransferase
MEITGDCWCGKAADPSGGLPNIRERQYRPGGTGEAAPMIQMLKRDLRRRLSERQLQQLRHLRDDYGVPAMFARLVNGLGPSRAADVKERIAAQGRLDYPSANIYLTLDSRKSVPRLRACAKEPDTYEWLMSSFQPDDVLYDIGANVGAYSLVAWKKVEGQCLVYAFEPSFSTFAALCRNIIVNKSGDRIVPMQIALSDRTSLLPFRYGELGAGAAMHAGIDDVQPTGNGAPPSSVFTQRLLAFRLDDLVRIFDLKPPTHLKIDVDGPELAVLHGAGDLIKQRELRSIAVELDENRYPNREIESLLESNGFVCKRKYARFTPKTFNLFYDKSE